MAHTTVSNHSTLLKTKILFWGREKSTKASYLALASVKLVSIAQRVNFH